MLKTVKGVIKAFIYFGGFCESRMSQGVIRFALQMLDILFSPPVGNILLPVLKTNTT